MLLAIAAMALTVTASNVLVQFLILDGLLTWGAFTYPLAFLITDVATRRLGVRAARRVVWTGFGVGLACSLVGSQVMVEVAPGTLAPAVALRVAVASAVAFLCAQSLDIAVFRRVAGAWWRAPLTSSVLGSALDTALFFTLAFSALVSLGPAADAAVGWARAPAPLLLVGPDAPLWVTLALADWGVKLAVALAALVPFRALTRGRVAAGA
ncbi:MAG: queuosine precursor transporter [Paracoccaceae bacterium]